MRQHGWHGRVVATLLCMAQLVGAIVLGVSSMALGSMLDDIVMPWHHDIVHVVVRGESEVVEYDGETHRVPGIEGAGEGGVVSVVGDDGETYLVSGLRTTGVVSTPDESLDEVPILGEPKVTDADGRPADAYVDVQLECGSIKVRPRKLLLRSADVSGAFSGHEVTNGETRLAEVEGLVGDDSVDVTFTGSRILPGKSENSFVAKVVGCENESCYDIESEFGDLVVEDLSDDERIGVAVKGRHKTLKADGKPHKLRARKSDSFEFEHDGVSYVMAGLDVGVAESDVAGTFEASLGAGKDFGIYLASDEKRSFDLSRQFDVTFVPGELTLTEPDVYVATFFGSNDDWTDSLYVSDDCSVFRRIGTLPIEMRDPSIAWIDGRFWAMTCRNDHDGAVWLDVTSSADLVEWSEPTRNGPFYLDVPPASGGDGFDVVAPEWFVDEDGSVSILISCGYWGETHGEPTNDHMDSYIMVDANPDYRSGESVVGDGCVFERMSTNEDGADRIDATIDVVDGTYWMHVKRNGLSMELWRGKACAPDGWERVSERVLYGFEGPCAIKSGDGWSMFADGVPDVAPYGVRRWVSDAIDGKWEPADVEFLDEDGNPVGVVRHGTVLAVDHALDVDAWDAVAAFF